MVGLIKKSILAGVLIGLAACIYMGCYNTIISAFLFSIGLIAVIVLQANLFTGKVGYINSLSSLNDAVIILCINLLVSYLIGYLYKFCGGNIIQNVGARFIDYNWETVLLRSIGTGILIYLAVEIYSKVKNILVVIICVMSFIIGGMYHCVADACYFGTCDFTISGLIYIFIVIVGNSIGSLLIRFLQIDKGNNI